MKSIFDYFNEKIRQAILGFKEKRFMRYGCVSMNRLS